MSRRIFQDDRMPWSFFLPITMAVVVGVLIADGVRYAIGEVFAARAVTDAARLPPSLAAPAAAPSVSAPEPVAASGAASTAALVGRDASASSATRSATASASAGPASTATPSAVSAPSPAGPNGTMPSTSTDAAGVTPPATASLGRLERLPGPVGARRDQQPRACINGTVALRDRNGWQQELSSDRPVRCEQTGP